MQAKRSCKLSWRLHSDLRQIALRGSCSDRSPLYDVRNHARRIPKDTSCETMFRGLSNSCCPMAHAVNTLDEERMACLDPRSSDRRRQPPKSFWWRQTGSNRRPHACKARALPAELWPLCQNGQPSCWRLANRSSRSERRMVGLGRFELPTSRLSSARSNQLSYKPGSDDRPETRKPRDAFQRARCESRHGLVHEERET